MIKSMGYSRQQEELGEAYDTMEISDTYLDIPHIIEEKNPLKFDEQRELFARLEQIDKDHIVKDLVTVGDALSRTKTAINKILRKYHNEIDLCKIYSDKYGQESLKDILISKGIKEKQALDVSAAYPNYLELSKNIDELTKERDELLEKRRNLIDNNPEYADIIDTLVTRNVKLVNWILRDYFKNVPLPKEEAQGLAFEGLSKAINRFDYTLGYNFSTYAFPLIITNIKRHFKSMMGITWRTYCIKRNIAYWREELLKLDDTRKTEYTPKELADSGLVKYTARQILQLDKSVKQIYNFSDISKYLDDEELIKDNGAIRFEDYHDVDFIEDEFVEDSLEYDFDEEIINEGLIKDNDMPISFEDYDVVDLMEDEFAEISLEHNPEEETLSEFLKKDLEEALNTLTEREKRLLSYRYGLEDGSFHTLDECGEVFYVSQERARQIEAKALRKLRHPNRTQSLKHYVIDSLPAKEKNQVTTQAKVDAFIKIYKFRDSHLSSKIKAFFVSTNVLKWSNLDIEEAERIIFEILLGGKIDNIIKRIKDLYGYHMEFKYPLKDIYYAIKELDSNKKDENDEKVVLKLKID